MITGYQYPGARATHDYMDIGDRAKQEARAEEQLPVGQW